MRLPTGVAFVLVLAAAMVASACGGGGNKTTVSTVAGGRTPAHTSPITGIGEVDGISNAALDSDTIQLAALVGYQKVKCSKNPGTGSNAAPLCRDNEDDGAEVEVLAMKACDQTWVRPEQVPDAFGQALSGTPKFDAAFVPKFENGQGAQYVVVFTTGTRSDGSPNGAALYIKDGRIAMIQTPCNSFSELVSTDVAEAFIATPVSGAGAAATATP